MREDSGTRLPPQDAATSAHQKTWIFGVSLEWKKAVEGFCHGQLVLAVEPDVELREGDLDAFRSKPFVNRGVQVIDHH